MFLGITEEASGGVAMTRPSLDLSTAPSMFITSLIECMFLIAPKLDIYFENFGGHQRTQCPPAQVTPLEHLQKTSWGWHIEVY